MHAIAEKNRKAFQRRLKGNDFQEPEPKTFSNDDNLSLEQDSQPSKNPYENLTRATNSNQKQAQSGLLLPLPDKLAESKFRRHRSQSKSITELLGELRHLSPTVAKQRLSQTRIIQSRKQDSQIKKSMELLQKQIAQISI